MFVNKFVTMAEETKFALNKKINEIRKRLNLSSSQFADYINVTRPILSHIINDRNKPGWDVIQKICNAFPELGLDWTNIDLPLDNELLIRIANRISLETHQKQLANLNLPLENLDNSETQMAFKFMEIPGKKIARILVLYSDNTFREYNPV